MTDAAAPPPPTEETTTTTTNTGDNDDKNKRSPSDFLTSVLGRPVSVQLNSGLHYTGVLASLDGYLNLAMEQTEEFEKGALTNKYGDCFFRGNNVLYIASKKQKM